MGYGFDPVTMTGVTDVTSRTTARRQTPRHFVFFDQGEKPRSHSRDKQVLIYWNIAFEWNEITRKTMVSNWASFTLSNTIAHCQFSPDLGLSKGIRWASVSFEIWDISIRPEHELRPVLFCLVSFRFFPFQFSMRNIRWTHLSRVGDTFSRILCLRRGTGAQHSNCIFLSLVWIVNIRSYKQGL